jgi:hypothetical protein
MTLRRAGTFLALSLALSGCGGGGGGSSPTGTPPTPTTAPTGFERLTITVPSRSSSVAKRTPRYISSLTQSATITVPGGPSTTFPLTPSTPNCTQGSAGLTCVITFPAPVGTASVQFATFASTDGTGTPLSVAMVPVTVTAGQVNDVTVTLNGVVKSLTVAVSPTAAAAGTAATINVSVSALDAGGAIIAGPGNYADAQGNTLTLTLSDPDTTGATHLSQTTFTAPPSAAVTLSYNGAAIADVTLALSASNVTSASATLHINAAGTQPLFVSTRNNRCGSGDPGDVYNYATLSSPGGGVGPLAGKHILSSIKAVGVALDRGGFEDVLAAPDPGIGGIDVIARYRQSDTGLTTPVYEITGSNTMLNSALAIAADSTGAVWVAQPATSTQPAMLMQFSPTANGNVPPARTITAIAGLDPSLRFTARTVAVDSHDNIYTFAIDPSTGAGRIFELAANSNGTATPLASYPIYAAGLPVAFGGGNVQFISVDQHTDAVWAYPVNIYPGDTNVPPPNPQAIDGNGAIRFSPGNQTGDRVLYGQNAFNSSGGTNLFPAMLTSMAFDDRGNVYVEYGVGTRSNNGCIITRVSTFSPSQHGNVAPVDNKTIGGNDQPIGIGIPYTTPPTSASSATHASTAVTTSPSSLSFVATGTSYGKLLTVSEPGYGGAFTANSANTAIATVQPSSSAGSFTVVAVGAGNTTITVNDASGNAAAVPVTATITAFHLQSHR